MIVKQWVTNERRDYQTASGHGASFWYNRGVRIFSGENAQCIQTTESEDNSPVLSPNKEEFALLGCFLDERNRWFHKIHKYRYVAEAEEGKKQQVTLPPRTDAELEARRFLHVENPNLLPLAGYTAEFEGQDRLVCHDRQRNVGYIFDFGFRAPQALGRVDKGKNKTTMEI
ncbi:hypothetical protein BJX65DRAFT_311871 [Aspergillus insuetus]